MRPNPSLVEKWSPTRQEQVVSSFSSASFPFISHNISSKDPSSRGFSFIKPRRLIPITNMSIFIYGVLEPFFAGRWEWGFNFETLVFTGTIASAINLVLDIKFTKDRWAKDATRETEHDEEIQRLKRGIERLKRVIEVLKKEIEILRWG